MKKDEKELIYDILKNADSYVCGYVRDVFKTEPVFNDDVFFSPGDLVSAQKINSIKSDEISAHPTQIDENNVKISENKNFEKSANEILNPRKEEFIEENQNFQNEEFSERNQNALNEKSDEKNPNFLNAKFDEENQNSKIGKIAEENFNSKIQKIVAGNSNFQIGGNFNSQIKKSDGENPNPKISENLNSALSLETLNEKIARCARCQLARTRNNVVPGMGVKNPIVLVVGEGPGRDEDMRGLPFVGKAGILLDKMLNAIDLDRNKNCYIANVVKCRPPENRNPLFEETEACFSFLQAQIHILKPKTILCMGKISAERLLNKSVSITQSHGIFFEYDAIPLMPTYHPSALLRNADLKRAAWEDLKKFKKKLEEIANI